MRVADDDVLMIFPTENILQSASDLSGVIQGQDILERETYRDLTLYLADKTTIAFAQQAVLVGPTDLVKTLLDVQAGEGERLIDDETFSHIQSTCINRQCHALRLCARQRDFAPAQLSGGGR